MHQQLLFRRGKSIPQVSKVILATSEQEGHLSDLVSLAPPSNNLLPGFAMSKQRLNQASVTKQDGKLRASVLRNESQTEQQKKSTEGARGNKIRFEVHPREVSRAIHCTTLYLQR